MPDDLSETEKPSASALRKEPGRARMWRWARLGLRFLAVAATGYLAWVVLMIAVYRFVDPPMSDLMLAKAWQGQGIEQAWLPLEDMPPALVKAVLISEDAQYCQHWGVDWPSMIWAWQHGGGGASTIPMQTVKNLFLWSGRSYVRKAVELPLAYVTSAAWGKRRMLEIYLNIAEWGPGVYGVDAAAHYHFKTGARQLSPTQASLLAAALPSPLRRSAAAPGRQTREHANRVRRQIGGAEAYLDCVL